MSPETQTAARAFVRSLNILLKFARLYEFGHAKTTAQFDTTWKELRQALEDSGGSGVLLGASGHQILLDGVPMGSSAGERRDRKSTRLNSSHPSISYAVFCLKKK